jgi:hypothetical protein
MNATTRALLAEILKEMMYEDYAQWQVEDLNMEVQAEEFELYGAQTLEFGE